MFTTHDPHAACEATIFTLITERDALRSVVRHLLAGDQTPSEHHTWRDTDTLVSQDEVAAIRSALDTHDSDPADTRPAAKAHRAATGHEMALVSAAASSCAECDWPADDVPAADTATAWPPTVEVMWFAETDDVTWSGRDGKPRCARHPQVCLVRHQPTPGPPQPGERYVCHRCMTRPTEIYSDD